MASDATDRDRAPGAAPGKTPRAGLLKWPRRVIVCVAGSTVLLAGIVILPLPGPTGTPIILLGLTILGSELPAAIRLRNRILIRLRLRKKDEDASPS
ncbi:MAG: PGPGW domain-containing protein [Planctomycetota bacterium]|nr:PGPGW domain-containing protein [Planctomycetota bacterium]